MCICDSPIFKHNRVNVSENDTLELKIDKKKFLVDNCEYVSLKEHKPDLRTGMQTVQTGIVAEQALHVAQHLLLVVLRLLIQLLPTKKKGQSFHHNSLIFKFFHFSKVLAIGIWPTSD